MLEQLGRKGSFLPIAIGAELDGEPVGLALAEMYEDNAPAELISIYTEPARRRRRVPILLLTHLQETLNSKGVEALKVRMERGRPMRDVLEALLQKCSFPSPTFQAVICQCDGNQKMKHAPWLKQTMRPAAFEIFLWKDLQPHESKHSPKGWRCRRREELISGAKR